MHGTIKDEKTELFAKLTSDGSTVNEEITVRSRKKRNGLRRESRFEIGGSKRISLNVSKSRRFLFMIVIFTILVASNKFKGKAEMVRRSKQYLI